MIYIKFKISKLNLFNTIQGSVNSIIKQDKTRSILAGFGITMGIFILILLLGTSKCISEYGIMKYYIKIKFSLINDTLNIL